MKNRYKQRVLVAALAATGMAASSTAWAVNATLLDMNFESTDENQSLAEYMDEINNTALYPISDLKSDLLKSPTPNQGTGYGQGTMYDEGFYIFGSNPHDYHISWADWSVLDGDQTVPPTNKMMIINGSTDETKQLVLSLKIDPKVCGPTEEGTVLLQFQADATNILPLGYSGPQAFAKLAVTLGGVNLTGDGTIINNDPITAAINPVMLTGNVPLTASGPITLEVRNGDTHPSGNDFALDNIKIVQVADCVPKCEVTHVGQWNNYKGNFDPHNPKVKQRSGLDEDNNNIPDLGDPNWHPLPATPNGEHALSLRGYNVPYQVGKTNADGSGTGKGDWFVWKDVGNQCPTPTPQKG